MSEIENKISLMVERLIEQFDYIIKNKTGDNLNIKIDLDLKVSLCDIFILISEIITSLGCMATDYNKFVLINNLLYLRDTVNSSLSIQLTDRSSHCIGNLDMLINRDKFLGASRYIPQIVEHSLLIKLPYIPEILEERA